MSIRAAFVVGLALICGLSAAWGMYQFRKPVEVEVQPETAPVLVAAVEIPRGQVISEGDVRVRQWPKEMLPPDVLTKVEEAVDRSAMTQVMAGEPILDFRLASKEAGRGMAALIPKGMRAYTIQTSRAAANVAGFVLPGNHVDVLLNLRGMGQNDTTGGGSTTTLLQSVEILAVNQELDAPAENKTDPKDLSSVTLLVTPQQAALLDLGQNMGQLTLALRNPEDMVEAETRPATLADIRFRQETPVQEPEAAEAVPAPVEQKTEPRKEEPEVFQIVTLRGSQRGQVIVSSGK